MSALTDVRAIFPKFPIPVAELCIHLFSFAAAKAQGAHLRVHYKNAVEVADAIRGMDVERAKQFLNNVLAHKEAVPFKHFKGGRGRHAQVCLLFAGAH